MSIVNLNGWIAAVKQRLTWMRTGTRTVVSAIPFSVFDIAGYPGVGVLAGVNTANGVVPTDAIAGYPIINALSASGYVSKIEFGSTVACRLTLFDRLFVCGAYNYNANVNLTAQPSYVGRLPESNYSGLEIWVETVVQPSGSLAVSVSYLDQDGNAGVTGAVGVGTTPTVGRCWPLPLASGDSGVQRIDNVTGSVAASGTACFNVMVLRRLWSGRVPVANFCDIHDMLKTGMPQIYADSALYCMITADSTAIGVPEICIEVSDG